MCACAFAESRIESHLRKHGVSSDDFLRALLEAEDEQSRSGTAGAARRTSLASSLLVVQSFEAFFARCQQRALEKA